MSKLRLNLPRGCAWTLLVVGALFFIVGVLSLIAIPRVVQRSREVWTETPGTISETHLKEGVRKSKSGRNKTAHINNYTVQIKYRYAVGGQEFSGDARALRQPENDEDRKQAVAVQETYPAGSAIPVFHHPTKPERSRLTAKEARFELIQDIVFAVLFFVSGGLFVWGARRSLRRGQ